MKKNYSTGQTVLLAFGILLSWGLHAQCPTITCPGNVSVNNTPGNCGAVVNYTAPIGTNPCGVVTQPFNYTGAIVNWTVPPGVTSIHIQAKGAQGGYNTNSTDSSGLGADMSGDFTVTPGQQLKLLVGEQPSFNAGNGGGGGSFVTDMSNTPLIIAGGGGGSSQGADSPAKNGQTGTSGGLGAGGGGNGGINGNGGGIGPSGFQSGAGGGLLTNGSDGWTTGTGGFAFVNGGSGGPTNAPARGGFGGGGSGSSYVVGGGGGGYSGGGSGGNSTAGVGGGGGSYNAGTNQVNVGGSNHHHGMIVISYSNNSTVTTTLTSGLGSGANFPVGTTTETYTVDDGLGNQSTCSFNVTVTDNEAPLISVPSSISVNNDAGVCGATVTFNPPVGTDNCSYTLSQTAGLASGSVFPVGNTTQTFMVTDASGNTASASFTVTVTDNEAPTLSNCPADLTVNNDPSTCGAIVTFTAPTGNDNCSASVTLTAGLPSGSVFPAGTTTETYQVSDPSGNTNTCSFNVTVVDNEAPSMNCPLDITVNNDPGMCSAVVNYTAPVGTDNCSATTTTLITGLGSGGTFPTGTTVESYQSMDAAGNISTCQFAVTVVDNEAPVITCPLDVTSCSGIVNNIAPAAVTDNCSGTPTLTYQLSGATTGGGNGDASGSNFSQGTTTVTYTASDANGNTGTCSFTVQVQAAAPPTLSATSTSVCSTDAPVALTASPSGGSWTGTGVAGSTFNPSVAGIGTFSPVYSYTNSSGCSASGSLNITVNACVGVEEQTLLTGVNVFPNPNNGTFNVSVNANLGDLQIEICDMQGRIVYSSLEKNVQAGFVKQLSPEVLSSGIYFLKLSSSNQQRVDKISIQK